MTLRGVRVRRGFVALVVGAVLASGEVRAGARLEAARWNPDDPRSAGSAIASDGQTITTPLVGRKPGGEVFVAGRLQLDTKGGREIDLSFLTDVPWVTCEAPEGLTADTAGRIDFVCRARARGLDELTEPLRVYVKVDPTGGLAHRKLYWVLEPASPP
jgi:hypothetical protein